MHLNQTKHNAASVVSVKLSLLCPQHTSAQSQTDVQRSPVSQHIANSRSVPQCIIPISQSPRLAPLLCISSIPSQALTCRSTRGQKPMQMLGRWMGAGEGQKHWNALTPVHLCAQAFPTKAQLWETITSVRLLWLYCCIIRWCCHHLIAQALCLHLSHIKWGEFKAFKMQNCQTATFLKLHCNCNEKMYRFILFTSVRHIKSFRACKATHLWGKRSAGKALLLFKPQQTRPSSAALGYCHYLISGPGFHKPNRKVCQAVKWREQNSASGREKKHTLETFHCGTQCTQEFKVSPIKASKNVLL